MGVFAVPFAPECHALRCLYTNLPYGEAALSSLSTFLWVEPTAVETEDKSRIHLSSFACALNQFDALCMYLTPLSYQHAGLQRFL